MHPHFSALLIGDALRLRAASRVVVCAGGHASHEPDVERGVLRLGERPVTYALLDLAALGDAPLEALRNLHAAAPQTTLLLLAHPSPPPCFPELLAEPWFGHLLALESPWFMEELAATLRKLERGGVLGLPCYLPWGAQIQEIRLTCSDDKATALNRIAEHMGQLGIGGRVMRRLQDIADEMIMNAIYDAPLDAEGRPKFAHLTRHTPVALGHAEQSTLSFGSDGRTFALGIRDPFGALKVETLKGYVGKGLRRGDDQIDQKAGGAGLGLYLQFDFMGSMVLNLAPGRVTEMIGLLDIRGSFRDLATAPKSFNCFVAE
ncbi:hypothetical protein L6V77_18655 [Myxococcota bacterium]|nr:hypothetical protein [Myxococcota bacterium]